MPPPLPPTREIKCCYTLLDTAHAGIHLNGRFVRIGLHALSVELEPPVTPQHSADWHVTYTHYSDLRHYQLQLTVLCNTDCHYYVRANEGFVTAKTSQNM
jgi:hypothetical protein